jgi:hypothetical protein
VADAVCEQALADEAEHAGELREHQDAAAVGELLADLLEEHVELRAAGDLAGGIARHQPRIAAHLAELEQRIEDRDRRAGEAARADLAADVGVGRDADRFVELAELTDRFVVTETRKVSADNIVSYAGIAYELPRGHAGTDVTVWRHLLSGALSVVHDGRLVALAPVDLAHNAVSRRAVPSAPARDDNERAPRTAAQLAFARDFAPVVGPDGGFPATPNRSSTTKGKPR